MRTQADVLLGLSWLVSPVVAGGFSYSAPNRADYCFYAIYTNLGEYSYYGETETSSSSSSGGKGSSSSSSGVASTPHGGSSSSSSSSSDTTKSHCSLSRSMRRKRGHHSSSTTGGCTSEVGVMSMYASAKAWCTKEQFNSAISSYWESLCEDSSLTLLSLTNITATVTDEYIASLPSIDPETNSTTTTGTIDSPVLLSHSYYKRAHKSYVTHDYAYVKDERYGWGVMGYWGCILVLGMMAKAWTFIKTSMALRTGDAEKATPGQRHKALAPLATILHFLRTYAVIPATFSPFLSNHQQLFLFHTIPKRLDFIIVLGFWVVAVSMACVDYQSFVGNISTPSLFQQNWQYSADRTGIVSYACLPFIWLFGGRNNIFLWATNFNVQSFNIFHRHTAWACTLLAIVHSIAYTVVFMVYDGRYRNSWKQEYWYMGVVATIVMSFMLVQSATWLRQKFYESFLIIHVVFATLTIYSLFMHTSFDGTTYNGYLWPMVAIWGFDRTMRFVRMAYCNLHVKLGKGFISTTSSAVTYSAKSDLVRIEMYPASKALKPGPGQHYYLYQPLTLRGWENHPFTLGCYDTTPNPEGDNDKKLIFYIRPYDGWTRRLRDQCRKAGSEILSKLMLEGPYGHQAPIHTFDTVLMIVGGTGIASAVPYILDHMSRLSSGKTNVSRIQLIWSGRQKQLFDEVCCRDLSVALEHSDISATLFCTDKSSVANIIESEATTPTKEVAADSADLKGTSSGSVRSVEDLNVQLRYGRPAIHSTVMTAVSEAKASSARLAVLTCGPAKMADECRASVYDAMKGGFQDIEYFEEAFGW
ncbi:ferric reductase transmembrane component 4 precursor [Aspergillus ellipticus CBS 707.79]|uniref:Ferric reductase transmembrane component 4 n=1 Tax=Aspergillus ellipticus CBS 707.79 TaxID=1448320 RepID=A0A319CXP2_9EURO|nr:ferric reductase transmembrane component 4 precursor [Aspergillus ellipticus CBS 707.79]